MTQSELNRALAGIMGWHLSAERWWSAEDRFMFHATAEWSGGKPLDYWNPCVRWDHFGPVLGQVSDRCGWVTLSLGTNDFGDYAVIDGRGLKECERVGKTRLEAACAAILGALGE